MIPAMIVSPHLDDAVLGCGQLMAGRPDTVAVTVFAGRPPVARELTTYDANCGFSAAHQAWMHRRAEDAVALNRVCARQELLGFVDGQYVSDRPDAEVHAIAGQLAKLAEEVQPEFVLFPVGLGHPDHQLVAAAGRAFMHYNQLPVAVYEELPYRVLFPETVPKALLAWGCPPALAPSFIGTGDAAVKEKALSAYRSQLWSLDEHARQCPERFHWVRA